jgi:hypothetical protein
MNRQERQDFVATTVCSTRKIAFAPFTLCIFAVKMDVGVHHVWDFSPDACRILLTLDDNLLITVGFIANAALHLSLKGIS